MQVFDGNEEQLVPLILQSLFSLISLPNLIAVGLVGMGTDYWSQKFSQKIFTKKNTQPTILFKPTNYL